MEQDSSEMYMNLKKAAGNGVMFFQMNVPNRIPDFHCLALGPICY